MMGLPMIMEQSWQRYFFHLNFLLSYSLLEETVPEFCSGPHPPPLSSYRPFNARALNGFWRTLAVFYHRFFGPSTSLAMELKQYQRLMAAKVDGWPRVAARKARHEEAEGAVKWARSQEALKATVGKSKQANLVVKDSIGAR